MTRLKEQLWGVRLHTQRTVSQLTYELTERTAPARLDAGGHVSAYLPISRHISAHFPKRRWACPVPHLPTSPHISPHLPMTQVDMSLAYALTSAIGIVVIPEITAID